MKESINYSDTAQNNLTIRDRACSSVDDYYRMVGSFNKVLDYKARFRNSLEVQLSNLGKAVNGYMDNLETLMRNIEVYDQNLDKVSDNLDDLITKENSIKKEYEELLNGNPSESNDLESCPEEITKDQGGPRETLIKRRQNYIETLGKSFRHLDDELFSIEKLKSELIHAKNEISEKKDEAERKVCVLKESCKRLLENVKNIEGELESSVKEEEKLIEGLKSIAEKIEDNMEINAEIKQILSTCLANLESKIPSKNNIILAEE